MRKVLFIVATVLAVAVAGIAYAQSATDTVTVTSEAAPGGTKKKPKAVAPTFTGKFEGPGGVRATTPTSHNWYWTNIREMGKHFPTCTREEIDAALSDSVCPKGSLVAEGTILAKIGPEADKASNIECSKNIRYYNEGAGRANLFAYGDPAKCAGIDYLSPIEVKWVRKGLGSEQQFVFPENIAHPFPGNEGGFTEITVNFVKGLTKKIKIKGKKKKVKIGYLTSYGCKGTRKFTFESVPATGETSTTTVDAGKC